MYALTGYPLGHSFSQKYFTEKFNSEKINEEYWLLPAPSIGEVKSILNDIPSLKGLNVTIPYKESIIPLLTEISEDARKIGAVNCVKLIKDCDSDKTFSIGYNTDWEGFLFSLKPYLDKIGGKALVLGSGGASKAVCYALQKLKILPTIVSRNPGENQIRYEDITPEIIAAHRLIVNTTPLGMFPETDRFPPIPYHFISKNNICYDLIYNPEMTKFMQLSKAQGAEIKNGLEMLYRQADLSWKIWNA